MLNSPTTSLVRPLSAGFWTWYNSCFSFCHSNLGLHARAPGSQLALGYLLGRNHLPFYSMLPNFFLPQGGFPKADGRHFTQDEQLFVWCFATVSLLLFRADLIEFLWIAGKDMNLEKFLVSYFIGYDYGTDKFYFVVHFFLSTHFSKRCLCQLYIFFYL